MNRTFSGPIRWVGTYQRGTKANCTYYREKWHTKEQCKVFKDHLEQLVQARHLKEFMVGQGGGMAGKHRGTEGIHFLHPWELSKLST